MKKLFGFTFLVHCHWLALRVARVGATSRKRGGRIRRAGIDRHHRRARGAPAQRLGAASATVRRLLHRDQHLGRRPHRLHARLGEPARNAFDIGVRAGYNLAISEPVTFWPTAGIFIHREFGTQRHRRRRVAEHLRAVPLPPGAAPVRGRRPRLRAPAQRWRQRLRPAGPSSAAGSSRAGAGARPQQRNAISALRTAMPSALREPTSTTRRLPRVTAV